MEKPESQTTPADGLESSASPRHPKGGVGTPMAGAGSIPVAGNPETTKRQVLSAMQNLRSCMDTTARIMELSKLVKVRVKSKELRGAISMLDSWIVGLS